MDRLPPAALGESHKGVYSNANKYLGTGDPQPHLKTQSERSLIAAFVTRQHGNFPPSPTTTMRCESLIEDIWNGNGRHPDVNIVPCSLLRR